jgi:hypothetical protein
VVIETPTRTLIDITPTSDTRGRLNNTDADPPRPFQGLSNFGIPFPRYPHIPLGLPINQLGPLASLFPSPVNSFLSDPLPTIVNLLPGPLRSGLQPLFPFSTAAPKPKSSSQAPPPADGGEDKPKKDGGKDKVGHTDPQCTNQEVSCTFLRESSYNMQNDDDECLKLATSFDPEGHIKFEPIAQDADNVIYGITTDGLTSSAWCNDVGWALRKVYINCRRGNKCYGGKLSVIITIS